MLKISLQWYLVFLLAIWGFSHVTFSRKFWYLGIPWLPFGFSTWVWLQAIGFASPISLFFSAADNWVAVLNIKFCLCCADFWKRNYSVLHLDFNLLNFFIWFCFKTLHLLMVPQPWFFPNCLLYLFCTTNFRVFSLRIFCVSSLLLSYFMQYLSVLHKRKGKIMLWILPNMFFWLLHLFYFYSTISRVTWYLDKDLVVDFSERDVI